MTNEKTSTPYNFNINEKEKESKMKILIAKTTLAMSIMTTGLHYIGHGVVAVEGKASEYLTSEYTNTISGLAKDMGFIKPVVLAPKTRNRIIAREFAVNVTSLRTKK